MDRSSTAVLGEREAVVDGESEAVVGGEVVGVGRRERGGVTGRTLGGSANSISLDLASERSNAVSCGCEMAASKATDPIDGTDR